MARWIGFGAGVALVAAVLVAHRIPFGRGSLGADVTLIAIPTGEIVIDHPGPFVQINDMRPGSTEVTGPSGSLRVTNIAGRPIELRLRALPSTTGLNDQLQLRVRAGRDDLLRGPLGALGGWSPLSVYLGTGRSAKLDVVAWLPASSGRRYQGVIDDVTLEFLAHRPGS
jgi:hypothetical protein